MVSVFSNPSAILGVSLGLGIHCLSFMGTLTFLPSLKHQNNVIKFLLDTLSVL